MTIQARSLGWPCATAGSHMSLEMRDIRAPAPVLPLNMAAITVTHFNFRLMSFTMRWGTKVHLSSHQTGVLSPFTVTRFNFRLAAIPGSVLQLLRIKCAYIQMYLSHRIPRYNCSFAAQFYSTWRVVGHDSQFEVNTPRFHLRWSEALLLVH